MIFITKIRGETEKMLINTVAKYDPIVVEFGVSAGAVDQVTKWFGGGDCRN